MAKMARKSDPDAPASAFPQLSTDPRCKPLWDWLNEHQATCIWTQKVTLPKSTWQPARQIATIECWRVGAGIVLLKIAEYGWGIYTEPNTNAIAATLADAAARVGILATPAPGAAVVTGTYAEGWRAAIRECSNALLTVKAEADAGAGEMQCVYIRRGLHYPLARTWCGRLESFGKTWNPTGGNPTTSLCPSCTAAIGAGEPCDLQPAFANMPPAVSQ